MFQDVVDTREVRGFWDGLGVDDAGMPIHLPMGVNQDGQGPCDPDPPYRLVCWCNQPGCLLNQAFNEAWGAGARASDDENERTRGYDNP